jgi:hypothetical protein
VVNYNFPNAYLNIIKNTFCYFNSSCSQLDNISTKVLKSNFKLLFSTEIKEKGKSRKLKEELKEISKRKIEMKKTEGNNEEMR